LSEPVDASLLAGAALVIGGIALVNARPGWVARLARRPAAVDEPLRT
jgi:drug/metabolite transporter (DMT)-like permease